MNPERPNIRRMQTVEEAEEVPFDIDKEITEKDWAEMYKRLEMYQRPKHESYADIACGMRILDPAKLPHPSEEVWARLQVDFNQCRSNEEWHKYAQRAYVLKNTWPDKKIIVNKKQADSVLSKLSAQLEGSTRPGNIVTYREAIRLIFPNHTLPAAPATEQMVLRRARTLMAERNWEQMASFGATARVAFPMGEFKFDPIARKGVSDMLATLRGKDEWEEFAIRASQIKMMLAKEIVVDERGITLIMPNDKEKKREQPETPPMPSTPEI